MATRTRIDRRRRQLRFLEIGLAWRLLRASGVPEDRLTHTRTRVYERETAGAQGAPGCVCEVKPAPAREVRSCLAAEHRSWLEAVGLPRPARVHLDTKRAEVAVFKENPTGTPHGRYLNADPSRAVLDAIKATVEICQSEGLTVTEVLYPHWESSAPA